MSHSTQTAAPLHYFHTFTQHSKCHTAHKQLHHCTISIPSPNTVNVTQHTTTAPIPYFHPFNQNNKCHTAHKQLHHCTISIPSPNIVNVTQHTNSCTIALFPYLHPT